MAKVVSKIYGEALYDVAVAGNKTKEILAEIQGVREILRKNPEFVKLMLHPSVSKQEKLEITEKVFKGNCSEEMTGFLMTIVEKERFGELDATFSYVIDRVKEEQGIGVAFVTTPQELNASKRQEVRNKLQTTTDYRQLEVHFDTDESLIGGIVIRIGDRVADASVRTKLNDLTQQLLQIQLG